MLALFLGLPWLWGQQTGEPPVFEPTEPYVPPPTIPTNAVIFEDGTELLLEDGDYLILEGA